MKCRQEFNDFITGLSSLDETSVEPRFWPGCWRGGGEGEAKEEEVEWKGRWRVNQPNWNLAAEVCLQGEEVKSIRE